MAIAVFATLSVMAYGGLHVVLDTRQQVQTVAERIGRLQLALSLIGRDLSQSSMRPVRDGYGGSLPPIQAGIEADPILELTVDGWGNPMGLPRSSLRRIAYGLKQKKLMRYTWSALDRVSGTEPVETQLVGGVTDISVRLLDKQHNWQSDSEILEKENALPLAVEFTLELEWTGRVVRLFPLMDGWRKPVNKPAT